MHAASVVQVKENPNIPSFRPGDTVRVSFRVREGDRDRAQVFQGVIIGKRGGGVGATFTVRRVTYGVGVERVFPLYSPRLESVQVVRRGLVRRGKLYYLRGLRGRAARIKERQRLNQKDRQAAEVPSPTPEPAPAPETAESVQE